MKNWLVAAALALSWSQAGAATWNVFSDDSDGMADQVYFFDADSVTRKGADVTVLFESLRDVEAEVDGPTYKTVNRMTFHCAAGTVEHGDEDISGWDGHVLHRAAGPGPAMKPHPASYEGYWLRMACSASFPQPQAKDEFSRVPRNDPGALALEYFRAHRARFAALNNDQPQQQPRAPREDCAGLRFTYANSLEKLPPGLQEALEKRGSVADVDGAFNAGDVIFDATPQRRFDGAAVADQRVFLAVEQGGIASNTQMWRFTRDGGRWNGKPLRYLGGTARTLQALLSKACKQYAPPPGAGQPARAIISCSEDDDRSISLFYRDSEVDFGYTLDRKAVARGIARRGRFVVRMAGDREPTPDEVASAQALLQAGRSSPGNHCPSATLDEFLQALSGHESLAAVAPAHVPSPADAALRDARIASDGGDQQAAIAALNRACRVDPRSAEAFAARGRFFEGLRNDKKALVDFDTALRLDPTQTNVRYSRAYILFNHQAQGRERDVAVRDLAILDKELPPGSDRRQVMASMYSAFDLSAQQIAELNLWMSLHGGDDMASRYADRCWARVLLNTELQQALADCNQALAGNDHDGETLERRGWLWLRMGKPDKALADFDKALAIDGVVELSLYGRALAHERLGQAADAKADFAQARQKILNIDSLLARKGLVPRSAMSDAQDRDLAKLLARARGQ